jgi:hypothetical protein
MKKMITAYEDNMDANPSKEVRLLEALKPFAPDGFNEKINNFIGMYKRLNILSEMQNHLRENAKISVSGMTSDPSEDDSSGISSSVHEDGVYDIDENCVLQRPKDGSHAAGMNLPQIMMLMAMAGMK